MLLLATIRYLAIVYFSEILTQNSIKCGNIHARRTNGIEIELCNFIFVNRTKIIFSRAKVPKKDKQSEHAAHDSAKMIFHSINYFFNAFHFTSQNYFLEFSEKNWYFVTKIILTYFEKKIVLVAEEKLLKFKAEGREFENFLRSLEQFIQTVIGQNNFW